LASEGILVTIRDDAIFQRTETGSDEIRKGKIVLRHNERLVLVLIDGVTNYAQLRAKMRGLVQERFDLALLGLQEKGLIVDILFPVIDQHRDAIAPEVLVDFLKANSQDSTGNSVSGAVKTHDPQNEHAFSGMISSSGNLALSIDTRAGPSSRMLNHTSPASNASEVDFFLPLDVSLGDVPASSRPKTKLVHVYPNPEKKRRKRSKRAPVVQTSWHIYAYSTLLLVGVLLVLYAIFFT
jgi:hypothetical protein